MSFDCCCRCQEISPASQGASAQKSSSKAAFNFAVEINWKQFIFMKHQPSRKSFFPLVLPRPLLSLLCTKNWITRDGSAQKKCFAAFRSVTQTLNTIFVAHLETKAREVRMSDRKRAGTTQNGRCIKGFKNCKIACSFKIILETFLLRVHNLQELCLWVLSVSAHCTALTENRKCFNLCWWRAESGCEIRAFALRITQKLTGFIDLQSCIIKSKFLQSQHKWSGEAGKQYFCRRMIDDQSF